MTLADELSDTLGFLERDLMPVEIAVLRRAVEALRAADKARAWLTETRDEACREARELPHAIGGTYRMRASVCRMALQLLDERPIAAKGDP